MAEATGLENELLAGDVEAVEEESGWDYNQQAIDAILAKIDAGQGSQLTPAERLAYQMWLGWTEEGDPYARIDDPYNQDDQNLSDAYDLLGTGYPEPPTFGELIDKYEAEHGEGSFRELSRGQQNEWMQANHAAEAWDHEAYHKYYDTVGSYDPDSFEGYDENGTYMFAYGLEGSGNSGYQNLRPWDVEAKEMSVADLREIYNNDPNLQGTFASEDDFLNYVAEMNHAGFGDIYGGSENTTATRNDFDNNPLAQDIFGRYASADGLTIDGYTATNEFGDTFEWTGSQWMPVMAAYRPSVAGGIIKMVVNAGLGAAFGQALGPLLNGALQGTGLSSTATSAISNSLASQLVNAATTGDFDFEALVTGALGGYLTSGGIEELLGALGADGGLLSQFEEMADLISTGIEPIDAIVQAGGEDLLKQLVTTGEIDPQQLLLSMAQQGMVEGFDWVMEEYGDDLFGVETEYHILDEDGNIVHTFEDYETAKGWADMYDGELTADGTFYLGESLDEYPEWLVEMMEGGGGAAEAAAQIIEAATNAGFLPEVGAPPAAGSGDTFFVIRDGEAFIVDYATGELVEYQGEVPDGLGDGTYDDVWRPTEGGYDYTYDPGINPGFDPDVDPVPPIGEEPEPTPDPVDPVDPVEPVEPVEPELPSRIEDVVTPIFDIDIPGLEDYEGNEDYTDNDQNEADESSQDDGETSDGNGGDGTSGDGQTGDNGNGDGDDGTGVGDGGDGDGGGTGNGTGDTEVEWSELFPYTKITAPQLSRYAPQLSALSKVRGMFNDIS